MSNKQWHGGKGDSPRGTDQKKYSDGWEAIFGKKKPEIKARKAQPSHSITQVHQDKSKQIPRKHKYNHIEDSLST
jgi:hypothetical protein|tara:strand:+ start:464 stop:688 length:225 start_codon:yes stop_codon:yes gene_type:complete